jgi:transmembrane sensor
MDNYQSYFNIGELITKYLCDELTDEENKQLEHWVQSDPDNMKLFRKLTDEAYTNEQLEFFALPKKDLAWKNIVKKTGFKSRKQRSVIVRRWLPYAAAVLLILTISTILNKSLFKKEETKPLAHQPTDIMPGRNKAILTLSNGSKIILDDVHKGTIARQQKISIDKTSDGEIAYLTPGQTKPSDLHVSNHEIFFNTITTPRGGQYAVVLPDGSKVWLNAASSLKYPTTFTGNQRNVELTGEAYFEIAKDASKPFLVKTADQTVEVLGTHFNINSYTDEAVTKTTLLEGSVKLINTANSAGTVLKPGQQAINNSREINVIHQADVAEAMAWKNGKFLFRNTDLKTIMRQLSRWYDVDVEYQGTITGRHYEGSISRDVPVSQIFQILKTSGINFTINRRTIIVKS